MRLPGVPTLRASLCSFLSRRGRLRLLVLLLLRPLAHALCLRFHHHAPHAPLRAQDCRFLALTSLASRTTGLRCTDAGRWYRFVPGSAALVRVHPAARARAHEQRDAVCGHARQLRAWPDRGPRRLARPLHPALKPASRARLRGLEQRASEKTFIVALTWT
eukprot:3583152-Rhodomonas_salina.2